MLYLTCTVYDSVNINNNNVNACCLVVYRWLSLSRQAPYIDCMLGHRLRRWPSIQSMCGVCRVSICPPAGHKHTAVTHGLSDFHVTPTTPYIMLTHANSTPHIQNKFDVSLSRIYM